ncbi:MAG: peptide chain release factor 3 [Bdellovibrionaceae bacterium]|nr:peptide chain release factor 3 [Pseudobdellovibrionaceae bacterium]
MSEPLNFEKEVLRRRTFAIISHPDAGKTTLTEKLIWHGGVIREAGEVKGKSGTKAATSDWMTLEQQRGISITSSVLQFDYRGLRVNLLDTPGHKDFSEDTYRTLVAADSAVMLIDVAKGVEERTKKLYEVCRYRHIPIFTFINKCDREGKAPLELIDEVEKTLQMNCYPITWPVGLGGQFTGLYHRIKKELMVYHGKYIGDEPVEIIPLSGIDDPKLESLVRPEVLAQAKEEIELIDGTLGDFSIEKFLAGELSPLTFGSAKQNFGIDTFLDIFCDYAPPPGERKTKNAVVKPLDRTFTGFVFKIQANMDRRHRDRIAFIRICSGQFERGMKVNHMRLGRELRLSFSSQFVAQERETVDVAYAGDIVGVGDTGHFQIGDSITTGKHVEFEDIPKFTPELFARVTVSDAMKRQKLQKALKHLSEEGAIQLFIDPAVGHQDPVLGVVGELQFEVLLFRLEDEYGLEGARIARLPLTVARWPRTADGKPVTHLAGHSILYRDHNEQPVLLLEKEWDLNWVKKENPGVEFFTSIQAARNAKPE